MSNRVRPAGLQNKTCPTCNRVRRRVYRTRPALHVIASAGGPTEQARPTCVGRVLLDPARSIALLAGPSIGAERIQPRWILRRELADLVELADVVGGELDVDRFQVVVELRHVAG